MNHKIRPPICHQIHHSNWWPTKFSDKNVTNIITQFSESPNEVTNMSHNSSPNLVITKFVTIFITKFVTKHGWVLYEKFLAHKASTEPFHTLLGSSFGNLPIWRKREIASMGSCEKLNCTKWCSALDSPWFRKWPREELSNGGNFCHPRQLWEAPLPFGRV